MAGLAEAESGAASGPLAVVDVGSNSGRVTVVQVEEALHLTVLAGARAPLRLVHDTGRGRSLSERTVERTVAALRGFRAVAEGAGAARIVAVGTSAVREANNGAEFLRRVREASGIEVRLVDGDQEAYYGFLGAVQAMPVDHGLVLDVGGGSIQLVHFREREPRRRWSLPLGALRLSEHFLTSDPPAEGEVDRLRTHVTEALALAGVPPLESDELLVGTGGSIRTLARIDRRSRTYPIPRLHGYTLHRSRVRELADVLRGVGLEPRKAVPGLNEDRADSIVGGALVVQTVMESVGAADLHVSGHGLREGVALDALIGRLAPAQEVRQASVMALARRFATWRPDVAERRQQIASALLAALDPKASEAQKETLSHAAALVDVGLSVDYYNRFEHAARVLLAADLGGFSHRSVAFLAATIEAADGSALKDYEPLLHAADAPTVTQAGAILALADALDMLLPPHAPAAIHSKRKGGDVALAAPVFDTWSLRSPRRRVERAFGVHLTLDARSASAT